MPLSPLRKSGPRVTYMLDESEDAQLAIKLSRGPPFIFTATSPRDVRWAVFPDDIQRVGI